MTSPVDQFTFQTFKNSVGLLAQQLDSDLWSYVMHDKIDGKKTHWHYYGTLTAIKRTQRLQANTLQEISRTRRTIVRDSWEISAAFDADEQEDFIIAMEPNSAFGQALVGGFEVQKDDTILAALDGTALGGENGTETFVLPTAQKVDDSAATVVTISKILQMKELLDRAHALKKGEKAIFVGDIRLRRQLLVFPNSGIAGVTNPITSIDFNTTKALAEGTITEWGNIIFVWTTRIALNAGTIDSGGKSYSYMFSKSGMMAGVESVPRISQTVLGQNGDGVQIAGYLKLAASRMEDNKVVRANNLTAIALS